MKTLSPMKLQKSLTLKTVLGPEYYCLMTKKSRRPPTHPHPTHTHTHTQFRELIEILLHYVLNDAMSLSLLLQSAAEIRYLLLNNTVCVLPFPPPVHLSLPSCFLHSTHNTAHIRSMTSAIVDFTLLVQKHRIIYPKS